MLNFTVMPDGGETFEVEAMMRDVLKWEKGGKGRNLNQLKENPSMESLYAIAHIAARRQQLFTGSLDEFEETCDLDFEEEQEDDTADPS